MSVLPAVVLAVVMSWLGGGCDDRRIDLRNVEAAMRDRYGHQVRVPIEAVVCPDWVRTRVGDTFECQVRLEGGVVWRITVTQSELGTTRWEPRGELVYAAELVSWLNDTLAARGWPRESRCAEQVYVITRGEAIVCHAKGTDGVEVPVRVVLDSAGGFRLEPGGIELREGASDAPEASRPPDAM